MREDIRCQLPRGSSLYKHITILLYKLKAVIKEIYRLKLPIKISLITKHKYLSMNDK